MMKVSSAFLGALILISILLMAGCSTLASHIGSEETVKRQVLDPTRADAVMVFMTIKEAPEKYVVIAKLRSKGDFCCDSQEKLIKAFREKAAELGADAVILEGVTTERRTSLVQTTPKDANDLTPGEKWGPVMLDGPLTLNLSGKGLLYKGYALAIELPVNHLLE